MGAATCPRDPEILQGWPPDEASMGLGQTGDGACFMKPALIPKGTFDPCVSRKGSQLVSGVSGRVSREGRRFRAARPLHTCRPGATIVGSPALPRRHTLSHKTWRTRHMPRVGRAGLGQGPS